MDIAKNRRIFIGAVALCVVAAMAFALFAPLASAQIYYGDYSPRTKQETVAYLNGVIAGILLRINSLQPGGQVRGVTYTDQRQYYTREQPRYTRQQYRIDVGTAYLRSSHDELQLNGIVELDDAPYAYVWFEYDTDDDDFDERTRRIRVTRDGTFSTTVDKRQFRADTWYYYRAVAEGPSGTRDYGNVRSLFVSGVERRDFDDDDDFDERPDAETERARDIDDDSAELNGEVDMNDFRNGIVFFVYGEDEDQVEDVERDYDSYRDVDEDGDDLQKVLVDGDLDGRDDYSEDVFGLDDDTEHFFQICVEYEDEDHDERLECGGVEEFETDRD